jgi:hypothetical protein
MTIAAAPPESAWQIGNIPNPPYPVHRASPLAVAEVERELIAWAWQYRLITSQEAELQFRRAGFADLAVRVYPCADDPTVHAKWIAWLFFFDDYFDDRPRSDTAADSGESADAAAGIARFLPVGRGAPAEPRSVLTAALLNLWPGMASRMSEHLKARFRRHADAYSRTYARPIALARDTDPPDLSAYVALRRDSGAVETCLDLIECRSDARLSSRDAGSAQLEAIRTAANDIICWTNDIASLRKEASHGELNNIVAVIRGATGMGWPAAVEIACRMVDARTREFDELCQTWLDGATTTERPAFVDGVRSWIAGSYSWHARSARYASGSVDSSGADRGRPEGSPRSAHNCPRRTRPPSRDALVRLAD